MQDSQLGRESKMEPGLTMKKIFLQFDLQLKEGTRYSVKLKGLSEISKITREFQAHPKCLPSKVNIILAILTIFRIHSN